MSTAGIRERILEELDDLDEFDAYLENTQTTDAERDYTKQHGPPASYIDRRLDALASWSPGWMALFASAAGTVPMHLLEVGGELQSFPVEIVVVVCLAVAGIVTGAAVAGQRKRQRRIVLFKLLKESAWAEDEFQAA